MAFLFIGDYEIDIANYDIRNESLQFLPGRSFIWPGNFLTSTFIWDFFKNGRQLQTGKKFKKDVANTNGSLINVRKL